MEKYKFELLGVENEEFEVPSRAQSFSVDAYDIVEAVRKADKLLYDWGVTGHLDDFTDDRYNQEETKCRVTYGDSERGWSILYEVEEAK